MPHRVAVFDGTKPEHNPRAGCAKGLPRLVDIVREVDDSAGFINSPDVGRGGRSENRNEAFDTSAQPCFGIGFQRERIQTLPKTRDVRAQAVHPKVSIVVRTIAIKEREPRTEQLMTMHLSATLMVTAERQLRLSNRRGGISDHRQTRGKKQAL